MEAHHIHDMRPVYAMTPWRLEMPQDLMCGGLTHPADIVCSILGDVRAVHCLVRKSGLTPTYPLADNYFANLDFANGVIARVRGLYGVVEPPLPMMQVMIYGSRASVRADFTDNQPGLMIVRRDGSDQIETHHFEAERDLSEYGHGATVMGYMKHLQDSIDQNRKPAPSELDDARTAAVSAGCWKSVESGAVELVARDF